MEVNPITGSILQILTDDFDGGKVLYRSYTETYKGRSVKKNLNNYYWKSSSFVIRKLSDLYVHGPSALQSGWFNSIYYPDSNRLYTAPDNATMLGAVVRLEGRHIRKRLDHLFHIDQAVLAYRIRPGSTDMASEF